MRISNKGYKDCADLVSEIRQVWMAESATLGFLRNLFKQVKVSGLFLQLQRLISHKGLRRYSPAASNLQDVSWHAHVHSSCTISDMHAPALCGDKSSCLLKLPAFCRHLSSSLVHAYKLAYMLSMYSVRCAYPMP